MEYLINLPKAKWGTGIRQVGTLDDALDWDNAIINSFRLRRPPSILWADADTITMPATAAAPADVMLCGFPNVLHPGQFITAGLSDGKNRRNTADVSHTLWGTEQASSWYAALAIAGDADADFDLKLMPWLRAKSLVGQVIHCGQQALPATGRKYGFTANELVGGYVLFISGDSAGQLFEVTANAEGASETEITVAGVVTLAAGDWFIVLPPTNFRWLGDVYVNGSGDFVEFEQVGDTFIYATALETYKNAVAGAYLSLLLGPPLASWSLLSAVLDSGSTTANSSVDAGHPRLTDYSVRLLNALYHETVLWNFPNGVIEVPIELCQYYLTMGGDWSNTTIKSSGFRYRPGLLA